MNANQMNWDMDGEQHQSNPFVMLHRNLRGKYILVIVLGLLFGVSGAVLGYMSRKPLYASTGIVRIQPELPKVLYESEQSTAPKMFTSFVNSQAQLIGNVDVVKLALESDAVKSMEARRGVLFDLDQVMDRLQILPDRRAQEIIRVTYEHTDPRVSQVIVDSVLTAYIEKYGKEGSIKNPGVVSVLKLRQQELNSERNRTDARIADIVKEFKTENLEPLIEEATKQLSGLKAEQAEIERYLGRLASTENGEVVRVVPETPEEASLRDSRMASLVQQRDALIENRDQMMIAEGLRAEHRDVRRVTSMIEKLQKNIDDRMEQLRSGEDLVLYDDEGNPLPSESLLKARQAELQGEVKEASAYAERLFTSSLALASLRKDQESIQTRLAEVNTRLDMIETESKLEDNSSISGKISIASKPIEARAPTSDPRIKMAAAGFVGMGSLPVIAIIALGYLSHRVKYSDDEVLTGAHAGIVGMLPDLGNSLEDQELASASAFAVHQIRSQLQIKNKEQTSRVYGVTSPAPGDGKTSLIIAMGLSFAESGNRTLLVDLDFIGRGLSIHFGHSRAPSLADRLTETEEVLQLVHETEFPGLSILPAGYGDDMRVSKLSPRSVEALLEPLKAEYDTILIDTGPILGSVEAAFVSPQADGVMLVVGRGQYKPLIKKAIDQIHAVDGTIAATIFNRASMHEIRHSTSSMSVHFSRQFSRQQQEHEHRQGNRVGPVAGSLFAGRRTDANGVKLRKVEP
ncbi:MAG: AAA family ATPase [Phycisphaerales bacterium]|nr:AAA family ATPase [Phycisphaerales bacterium]